MDRRVGKYYSGFDTLCTVPDEAQVFHRKGFGSTSFTSESKSGQECEQGTKWNNKNKKPVPEVEVEVEVDPNRKLREEGGGKEEIIA